jgi:hypothetical protein
METITLSMEDVRHLKHNLDNEKTNDFMENYGWDEDEKLLVQHVQLTGTWGDKEIVIYALYGASIYPNRKSELGYAITIDGKLEYLVGMYEPMGSEINENRGLISFWCDDEFIQLWLDNGEFNTFHIR